MVEPLRLDYAVNDADVIAAFKRQQAELEKERKARQELQKTINEGANAQKDADKAAAEAARAHAAAVRDATQIAEKYATKEERVAAELKRLNELRDKGVLSSRDYSRAVAAENAKLTEGASSANSFGGALSSVTGKMVGAVAGFASMSAVVAAIRTEYDALLERQGKSRDANISLAAEQEALLMNLGDADAGQVTGRIRNLSQSSGVKEENITRAVNEAMAARADLSVDDVVAAVGTASKIRKFAPAELAGLAGATIDTQKQTGLGTDQSLGFLLQLQAQSRTKSLKGLAENFTPAVGGVMNFGADRQTAGALLAALSHGMGDTTGAQAATSGVSLAKQLREYGKQGGPELDRQMQALSVQQDQQKAAMVADFDKRGIALNAQKMSPEKKAELRRQLAVEERERKAALKELHSQQTDTLQSSARAIPIGDVIARMRSDPEYRNQFLQGKDQGGFGASFEVKALPAIESLLSGGKQAAQFDAARQALFADPTQTLNTAIAARDLPSLNLAAYDQKLENTTDQIQLGDQAGATAAVTRERLKDLRLSLGKSSIGTKVDSVLEDLSSGGNQDVGTAVTAVERLHSSLNWSKGVARDRFLRQGNFDLNNEADKARFNQGFSEEWGKTVDGRQQKILQELVDQLKGLRADQQGGRHAGIVANRRDNQNEGAR